MPATVVTGNLAPERDGAHSASPGRTATGKGSDATQISSSSECKYCSTPTAEARGYEVLQPIEKIRCRGTYCTVVAADSCGHVQVIILRSENADWIPILLLTNCNTKESVKQ